MPRFLVPLIVAAALLPTAASAHSSWVRTNPDHGAELATLPSEATVTLGEAPKQADVVLTTPDRETHTLQKTIAGSTVIATLPSDGPRGEYVLSYRVVSADGHPVTGSATFTVTSGPTAEPLPTATPTATTSADAADSRTGGAFPIPTIAILGIAAAALFALVLVAGRARRR